MINFPKKNPKSAQPIARLLLPASLDDSHCYVAEICDGDFSPNIRILNIQIFTNGLSKIDSGFFLFKIDIAVVAAD